MGEIKYDINKAKPPLKEVLPLQVGTGGQQRFKLPAESPEPPDLEFYPNQMGLPDGKPVVPLSGKVTLATALYRGYRPEPFNKSDDSLLEELADQIIQQMGTEQRRFREAKGEIPATSPYGKR